MAAVDKKYIRKWANHFKKLHAGKSYKASYLKYVSNLSRYGLPVIFEYKHLAALLGRTPEFVIFIVHSPQRFYSTFKIPKRSGGHREINVPYPSLLECHQWILKNILNRFALGTACHGFVREKSIITNAKEHLGKKFLLKMDIKDFFHSIKLETVERIFYNAGYSSKVSKYLAAFCCLDNSLPQGAPTSPALSNIAAYHMDKELCKAAEEAKLTYTRYADDLTFSGEMIYANFKHHVAQIAKRHGFDINHEKTLLIKGNGQKIVTGISVSGGQIRLPKKYKRNLRQEAYHYLTKGFPAHAKRKNIDELLYKEKLLGKLQFWKQVEPENSFLKWAIEAFEQISANERTTE